MNELENEIVQQQNNKQLCSRKQNNRKGEHYS